MKNTRAEIEVKCKECGASKTREFKVGDVVVPNDPSGMPLGLATILSNEGDINRTQRFKPVVVAAIKGEFLGVIPVGWKGVSYSWDFREFTDAAKYGVAWLDLDYDDEVRQTYGKYGYWVWAWCCHFTLQKEA